MSSLSPAIPGARNVACLWWHILISPSSLSYFITCLTQPCCPWLFTLLTWFCRRKNTLWLLVHRLDFNVCPSRLFPRSKHYLDSTKKQQIQEANCVLVSKGSYTVSLRPCKQFCFQQHWWFPLIIFSQFCVFFSFSSYYSHTLISNCTSGIPPDIALELTQIWGLQMCTCFEWIYRVRMPKPFCYSVMKS